MSFIAVIIVNEYIFIRLIRKQKRLHYSFFRRLLRIIFIVACFLTDLSFFPEFSDLWKSVLGSAAVIGAVIGFAAQNILKNILAGLMLSIDRPFEIGDRVILAEMEKACVVEAMTIRNIILKTMDGLRYIVPNSEMDQKIILNTSFRQQLRGSFIQVPISYDSDISLAIQLVRDAVKNCPHTKPNNEKNVDLGGYGDVYLIAYGESAFILETVIWTEPETDNFLACSEVRIAIVQAFRKHGIEIPYNYINVVNKEEKEVDYTKTQHSIKKHRRNTKIKTDEVLIDPDPENIDKVVLKIRQFSEYYSLGEKNGTALELLTEEMINFSLGITEWKEARYWVEGTREKVYLHLKIRTWIDKDSRKALDEISTDGLNESSGSFKDMIRRMIANSGNSNDSEISYSAYKQGAEDDFVYEKNIITALADDIRITARGEYLTMVVIKKMEKN